MYRLDERAARRRVERAFFWAFVIAGAMGFGVGALLGFVIRGLLWG